MDISRILINGVKKWIGGCNVARQIGAFAKDDGRQKLYDSGLTDKEIGEKLYLHETSVFGWRTRRGYPANGGTGIGGLRVNNKRHEKAMGRV